MTLPNFLHVGAAKTGTTSLYFYLRQHPDVFMSPKKGPEFFVARFKNGFGCGPGDGRKRVVTDESAYRALFDDAGNAPVVGESSVSYLYHHDEAIPMIRDYLGDPRILITLRNPADLAFSTYMHLRRQGREKLSFAAALEAEPERIAMGWNYQWHYRRLGLLSEQVAPYIQNFSRVHVLTLEDLVLNPRHCLCDLFTFLGVDNGFEPDTSVRYNRGGMPRSRLANRLLMAGGKTRPRSVRLAGRLLGEDRVLRWREALRGRVLVQQSVDPSLRLDLLRGYRQDIEKLQALLGRDLSAWFDEAHDRSPHGQEAG